MSRPYQVVIFGASGFTGEYVVEQLAKYLNKSRTSLSWAAAGRSEAKVRRTLLSVGIRIGMKLDTIPIITGTVGDDSSLDSMTKQTVLLLNITGPYSCYGEAVVASCVRNSCHYIDIVDIYEPLFMEIIQLKYQEVAAEKGIYIILSCGFDSIPWDMGVNFIKDAFKPGKLNSIESFLTSTNTTGYHTTWDCAVDVHADKNSLISTRKLLYEQQYGGVSKIEPKILLKLREPGRFSDQATRLNGWIVPFGNGDQFVVRKSQMANNILYGEKDMAQMKAYIIDNLFNFLRFILTGFWIKLLSPFSCGRTLLKMFPGFFSSGFFTSKGARREETDAGFFSLVFLGKGWKEGEDQNQPPESKIAIKVSGPDLGYPTCAICVTQAALTLLQETATLPSKGGVYTPGTVFRKTSLVNRLVENGVTFKVI